MERIVAAVEKRQRILNFLIANPHAASRAVAEHIGIERDAASRILSDMIDMGEVQRHESGRSYTACKTRTRSVDEILALSRTKKRTTRAAKKPKPVLAEQAGVKTGRTRNDPSKHKPHPNQGGQVAASSTLRSSQMAVHKVSM